MDNSIQTNASGYFDSTAYNAIKNVEAEEEADIRFKKFLHDLFEACDIHSFYLENHVIVKDKKTGKVYR